MQEVNIAVLGAAKTGKSTFVQCALDLKKPATAPASTKKVSLEGTVSLLRLLEFQLEEVEIAADQSIDWPSFVDSQEAPRIDGVLLLYDVMNKKSIARLPNFLSKFQSFHPLMASFC